MKEISFEDFVYVVESDSNILITAPHGSRLLPEDKLAPEPGDRGTDLIAKEIANALDANLFVVNYSRMLIDINRQLSDAILVDFHQYKCQPLNYKRDNLEQIYSEYYDRLKKSIHEDTIHIAIHSMYHEGPKGSIEEGKPRPDFRLGTLDGKTMSEHRTNVLKAELETLGYSAEINNVFRGGEEIRRTNEYGANCIQIEINSKHIIADDIEYSTATADSKKVQQISQDLVTCLKTLIQN